MIWKWWKREMTARLPVTVSSVQTWFYMLAYVKKSSPGSTQLPTSPHLLSPSQPLYSYQRDIHLIIVCGAPRAYGLAGQLFLLSLSHTHTHTCGADRSKVFVSTDARRPYPRGVIRSTVGAYPRGTGSNPVEEICTFFPHSVSSIFRLSLTRFIRLSGGPCRCLASQFRR